MELNKNHMYFELFIALLGVFLTLIFLDMTRTYWTSDAGWFMSLALSFLVASFIASSLGMILQTRSRVGGSLLLIVSLQFGYIFFESGFLRFDGVALGALAGGCLTCYSYVNNRFDKLAVYVRRLIKIFFVLILLYLLSLFIVKIMAFEEISQLSNSNDVSRLLFLLGIFSAICYLLTKNIHGIRAYDVFVYGPSRSGKTLLLLAFYSHFVTFLSGERKEFIVSDTNEERLKIKNMLVEIESGELPKSNLRTDLAIYALSGVKALKRVGMTFVDYGGEHTNDFKPLRYKEVIAELNKYFNIIGPHKLEQSIGDIEYIKSLRDSHKNEFAALVDKVTFAHIYNRFESAGKIIFLVDGDHIISYFNEGKNELTKIFGHYADIIKLFGDEKEYAIVVTKVDQFKDISALLENSNEAREIEREIYDLFCEVYTFKEIVHMAYRMPIYMYAISVDATKRPLTVEAEEEAQSRRLKINPWRVGEIGEFSF